MAAHCVTKGDLQTAALDNSVLAKLQALKLIYSRCNVSPSPFSRDEAERSMLVKCIQPTAIYVALKSTHFLCSSLATILIKYNYTYQQSIELLVDGAGPFGAEERATQSDPLHSLCHSMPLQQSFSLAMQLANIQGTQQL